MGLNTMFKIERKGVLINPYMLPRNLGDNINGPSLIKVPKWVESPFGKYYLYFAHHQGQFIRMAYSNTVDDDYRYLDNEILHVNNTPGRGHVASPDVHIDNDRREIVMYYHSPFEDWQYTFKAISKDGLTFRSEFSKLGLFYFRVFYYEGRRFAIAKNRNISGIIYENINNEWIVRNDNFIPNMRHSAVLVKDGEVIVFYSVIGHMPETIWYSRLDMNTFKEYETKKLMDPLLSYEGSKFERSPSTAGSIHYPVCQLRDPAIYEEDGEIYLLYSIQGEQGIAIGRLIYENL